MAPWAGCAGGLPGFGIGPNEVGPRNNASIIPARDGGGPVHARVWQVDETDGGAGNTGAALGPYVLRLFLFRSIRPRERSSGVIADNGMCRVYRWRSGAGRPDGVRRACASTALRKSPMLRRWAKWRLQMRVHVENCSLNSISSSFGAKH